MGDRKRLVIPNALGVEMKKSKRGSRDNDQSQDQAISRQIPKSTLSQVYGSVTFRRS
jgi:hypothetical protein